MPLTAREVLFNPVEAGTYVARLQACDQTIREQPAVVRPGETTPLVVFES